MKTPRAIHTTVQTRTTASAWVAAKGTAAFSHRWVALAAAALLALPVLGPRLGAQAGTITPTPFQTVFDNSGRTVNNACVWTYTAGTTTPAATYTDAGLTTPNANPIRSDSAGRFTAFLAPATSYKYVYEAACTPPSHGVVYRTADNISSVPTFATTVDINAAAGETINIGQCAYLSDGGGSRTVGQWYKCDNSVSYAYPNGRAGVATATISSGTTGTVRIMGLVTGLSGLTAATRYWAGSAGALTSTAPSPGASLYAKPIGFSASTTSLIVDPVPGVLGAIAISDMAIQDSTGGIRFANGGTIKEYATSPEAGLTAAAGSLSLVIGGGAGLTGYLKESGAGNTGWLPITTTTASGVLNVVGNFSVATNKLTVAASSGNTVAAGTFIAGGKISSTFSASGNVLDVSNSLNGGFGGFIMGGGSDAGHYLLTMAKYDSTQYLVLGGTGLLRLNVYGAGTATFDANGNITSVSDERKKDLNGFFGAGLAELMGVRPILFHYRASTGLDTGNTYAGFSAQNVLKTIPEAIGKDREGYYSVNVVPIVAALVTGEQQLAAEIDELRAALKLPKKNRKPTPGAAAAQRIIDSAKAKSGGR